MNSDYLFTSGTATIPAGQTCATVTVPIVDDQIGEPTESLTVNLTLNRWKISLKLNKLHLLFSI